MTAEASEPALAALRARIDTVDEQLVQLIAERMRCVEEVIGVKTAHGLPARITSRVEEVVARVRRKSADVGAPPDLAEAVWRTMIEWVIAYEDQHLGAR